MNCLNRIQTSHFVLFLTDMPTCINGHTPVQRQKISLCIQYISRGSSLLLFFILFFFFPWEEYSVSTTHSVVVKSLRRLYFLDFQLFVQGIQLMSLPVCFHAHKNPSEKRSTLLGKNLLPRESKFFPSRVDPFSEGRQKKHIDRVVSHESAVIPFKMSK